MEDDYFTDNELYSKVDGNESLVRDKETGAIIYTNESEYNAYIQSYKKRYSELKKIDIIENEMNEIKNDIGEIKNLLKSLLSK
jgi:hypothetical protein